MTWHYVFDKLPLKPSDSQALSSPHYQMVEDEINRCNIRAICCTRQNWTWIYQSLSRNRRHSPLWRASGHFRIRWGAIGDLNNSWHVHKPPSESLVVSELTISPAKFQCFVLNLVAHDSEPLSTCLQLLATAYSRYGIASILGTKGSHLNWLPSLEWHREHHQPCDTKMLLQADELQKLREGSSWLSVSWWAWCWMQKCRLSEVLQTRPPVKLHPLWML